MHRGFEFARWAGLPLVLCLVATACGGGGASTGRSLEVGGRSLYLDCRGQGSPTIILETGLTADRSFWSKVHDELAKSARVCAYDRAGNGKSDPAGPHTGAQSVADLHGLLGAADIKPPLVLVGWSIGGLISRLYAGTFPEDVAGMVLIDTPPPAYFRQGDPLVPADQRQRSMWADENGEQLDVPKTFLQVLRTSKPGSLGDRPLIVLTPAHPTSGEPPGGGSPGLPVHVSQLDELYLPLQRETVSLSRAGQIRLVADTGHCIQCDQPATVIGAVKEVIAAATQR